jgi:hypothetical protein
VSGESKWWWKALHKLTDIRVSFHQQIIGSHQSCLIIWRPTKLKTSVIDKIIPFIPDLMIPDLMNRKAEQTQVFPLRTSLSSLTRSGYGVQKSKSLEWPRCCGHHWIAAANRLPISLGSAMTGSTPIVYLYRATPSTLILLHHC